MPYAHPGEALFARLTSAVSATTAAGNVFPQVPTEETNEDYVVYRRVSGGGATILTGRSGLQEYLYRVDVYASTELAGELILKAINHQSTGLPGWSDTANNLQGIFPADDADSDVLGDNVRIPGQSFSVWFQG